jgi:PAS domain S-box-containing protein
MNNHDFNQITKEESIGMNLFDCVQPDYHLELKNYLNITLQTGLESTYEVRGLDGIWYGISILPNRENSQIVGFIITLEDKEEKKQVEIQHKDSMKNYQTLFNSATIGIFVVRDDVILDANHHFAQIFGYYSQEELVNNNMSYLFDEEIRNDILERGKKRMEGKPVPTSYETIGLKKDGTRFPIHLDVTRLKLPDGLAILAFVQDISKRKNTEKILKESEEKYRIVSEAAFDAIVIRSLEPHDKRILEANESFAKMWGYDSVQEMIHMTPKNLATPKSVETIEASILRGDKDQFEFIGVKKDGSRFHCESVSQNFNYKGKKARISAVRDITQRKEAEQALAKSEARFRSIFQNAPIAFSEIDVTEAIDYLRQLGLLGNDLLKIFEDQPNILKTLESKISRSAYNTALLKLLEVPDEQTMSNFVPDSDNPKEFLENFVILIKNIENPEYYVEFVGTLSTYSGKMKNVIIHRSILQDSFSNKIMMLNSIIDITQRIQAEGEIKESREQLYQIQKMEAINRLASGIAHDFNNMLAIIQSHCDLILVQLLNSDPLYDDIQNIQLATEKAAALTKQLIKFSRKQVLKPSIVNLNNTVKVLTGMFERIIPKSIRLTFNLDEDVRPVNVDPPQIGQVLMNLIVNAVEAMPDGGILTITTQNNIKEGMVQLSVRDTGSGMTEEVKNHLFEPFFTTKTGKGTGLGLATSYGIIQQSGGAIDVESEVGKGSTFNIVLPTT